MRKKEPKVTIRYAESLAEVYQHIDEIAKEIERQKRDKEGENEKAAVHPRFWFRGHAKEFFNLNPTIYRAFDGECNRNKTYTTSVLREEYRFQSFMARNYDKLTYRMPQSVIEWQEVMQHYFVKTRLMDWSESLTIALEFALEDYIKPINDLEVQERRRTSSPAIWILTPDELNQEVYNSFAHANLRLINKALKINGGNILLAKKIQKELLYEAETGLYYNLAREEEGNMNFLVSLSSLELLRNAYKGREWEALQNFEMNPFFYLLLRYYSDGLPVDYNMIPPLAIIHPYHSERIRIQKGVFTVFPHYILDKRMDDMKQTFGDIPIGMEYMDKCIPFLHKIQILNPQRVSSDLMRTGARRGNLYPDIQIASQDMENVIQ